MSFVVQINDMNALLESWNQMLATANGSQVFTMNDEVLQTLSEWPRIRFFYYCDNDNGNTLRIYDTEHFERFGGSSYLERDESQSQGHYERVILRGKNMWAVDEANLKRPQSLRKRFRDNPAWVIFSASQAPIRPGSHPPVELGLRVVRRGNLSTVDIERGMVRERRLWYFESLNQLPVFNPHRQGVQPSRPGAAMSLAERLKALR